MNSQSIFPLSSCWLFTAVQSNYLSLEYNRSPTTESTWIFLARCPVSWELQHGTMSSSFLGSRGHSDIHTDSKSQWQRIRPAEPLHTETSTNFTSHIYSKKEVQFFFQVYMHTHTHTNTHIGQIQKCHEWKLIHHVRCWKVRFWNS